MAKKVIRPLRSEADYDAALEEVERYFENEPKPGTRGHLTNCTLVAALSPC